MTFSAFQFPSTSFLGSRIPCQSPCASSISHLKMASQLPGGVTVPQGFKAAAHTAGFKPSGLSDLALVLTTTHQPVTTAALFTKNRMRAAPVDISFSNMQSTGGKVAAILLNSGQANASTGTAGYEDGIQTTLTAAKEIGCMKEHVFICSTGVIGKRFDISLMQKAIPEIVANASETVESGTAAAQAIMTTDLKMKQVAYKDVIGGVEVKVGGMCKGSGMIHPNMATMLAVVTCDAQVESGLWQDMLKRAVDKSFHAITVDGDTSTNDVICAMCSGESGLRVESMGEEAEKLEALLTETCVHLAKSVARDGEGATVLLEVDVIGAKTDGDAREIARTVASSNLTKAAIFGRDPNWGRISAAAGRASATVDVDKLEIKLGEHLLMKDGNPVPFDAAAASKYLSSKAEASSDGYMSDADTVAIKMVVGNGPGHGIAWGCDLSYKYVEINADYTT